MKAFIKSIDWKSRIKNKAFWVAVIPATLIVIQMVLVACGVTWDYAKLNSNLLGIVNSVFALLSIFGIVVDTSTPGIGDTTKTEETVATTSAAALGENYNRLQTEATDTEENTETPAIEGEKIVETEDESLEGNDVPTK